MSLSADDSLPKTRHNDRHHIYPKSRVPIKYRAKFLGKWMVIVVSIKAHNAFHIIFGNRTPDEQKLFLKKLCDKKGILNSAIYSTYQKAFDDVFGGDKTLRAMLEILKKWDFSDASRKRYADKFANLNRILNDEIKGGIPFRKFKLN